MKRNSIFLSIFLLLISLAHAQTLKKEFHSEQQIDVIENLGDFIPLDTIFIDESGSEVELSTFFNKEIPTVLTLNYFECPMLCTLVLNGLAESLKNLNETERKKE
jgi:protein SCO1/2